MQFLPVSFEDVVKQRDLLASFCACARTGRLMTYKHTTRHLTRPFAKLAARMGAYFASQWRIQGGGGVRGVQMHPPFEGLPSRVLSKSAQT